MSTYDAEQFMDKQWEFCTPRFERRMGHLRFSGKIILPFVRIDLISRNDHADFQLVAIHPEYSGFDEPDFGLSQSQSSSTTLSKEHNVDSIQPKMVLRKSYANHLDDVRELHALKTVQSLKHPNIIKLIGSYTCQDTTNLFFPPLIDDVKQLLACDKPPPHFQSKIDFLYGLCGLASAIEAIHYDVVDTAGEKLVGIHGHICPTTILIHEKKFILTGFEHFEVIGHNEGDYGSHWHGWDMGDYYAPECQGPDFEFGRIGLPSDVWSFGCLLAEIGTYLLAGHAEGVQAFRESRKVILGPFIAHVFFSDTGPSTGVTKWLTELQECSTGPIAELLKLTTEMLQIEPKHRSSAKRVARRLRLLFLLSKVNSVNHTYSRIVGYSGDPELGAQWESFQRLKDVIEWEDLRPPQSSAYESNRAFTRHANLLHLMVEELTTIDKNPPKSLKAAANRLSLFNVALFETLPPSIQSGGPLKENKDSGPGVSGVQLSDIVGESDQEQPPVISNHSPMPSPEAEYPILLLPERSDKGNSKYFDRSSDKTMSAISDRNYDKLQKSSRKSTVELIAEEKLAEPMARNEFLRPLYQEAISNIGRTRFVENFRTLLKRWYLDLIPCGTNNLERATISLLRNRRNRSKIAHRIVDMSAPKSEEARVESARFLIKVQGKAWLLEDWIINNPGLADRLPLSNIEVQQEHDFDLSNDKKIPVAEHEGGPKDMRYIKKMETFLINGRPFQKLLMNFQIFLLPGSLRSLVRGILSIPGIDIRFSSEEDHTIVNRLKLFLERITHDDWIWWPFQATIRPLQQDETRLIWKCVSTSLVHCQ